MTSGNTPSGWRGGTHPAGVPIAVGIRVGNGVGVAVVQRSWVGPGTRASPVGGAVLRILPAKQHAPKARPTTHHRQWPAGGVPGRPSSTNGLTASTCAVTGCRTFALDRQASPPWLHHERPGGPCGRYAGGRVLPPAPPSSRPARRPAVTADTDTRKDDMCGDPLRLKHG